MRKEFYTTGDIAKICSVSTTTVFRAIVNKQLRAATTPGGHYRISCADLEGYLKKNNISLGVLEPRTKRILIVEDNPAELRMFQRALEAEPNFDVKTTDSGYEAGFLTQSYKPDLILLDIFLKDVDGREVAKLIRSDPSLRHTKIVAISAAKSPKDIKEIQASGVDLLIQKPVSPSELREKLKEFLK